MIIFYHPQLRTDEIVLKIIKSSNVRKVHDHDNISIRLL